MTQKAGQGQGRHAGRADGGAGAAQGGGKGGLVKSSGRLGMQTARWVQQRGSLASVIWVSRLPAWAEKIGK